MPPPFTHTTGGRITVAVIAALALLLVILTVLPYIETNRWFIRMVDFPRLQILIAIVVVTLAAAWLLRRRPRLSIPIVASLLVAAAAHVFVLWPFRPGGENFVDSCPPGAAITVMVSNVLMKNRDAAPLLRLVQRERPDILLALETDDWWDDALEPLAESMPHRKAELGKHYYGMHLFSRLPLDQPDIRYLAAQDVPAVFTGVRLDNGETIGFIGLHPRPPHPSQRATGRDAQLYETAFLLRDSTRPTIVAGDLNATPWETSIERMRRVGELIDPRRGYGYLATYSATSWFRSWPLDHVLHESGFATMRLTRLDAIGSDHYPYLARLCRVSEGGEAPPALHDDDLDEARTAIAAALDRARVRP